MTSKIVKTTSKGQITLPKAWRDQFNTDDFLLEVDKKMIVIKPIQIEEVIFDADRDNEGDGVSVDEMIKMLKQL